MRTLLLAALALLTLNTHASAQGPTGDWYTVGEVMGQPLRMNLHLSLSGDSLLGTLDSPDQDLFGLPLTGSSLNGETVGLEWSQLALSLQGSWTATEMHLNLVQHSLEMELDFGRTPIEKPKQLRPQEPQDFPYVQEEVAFTNPHGGHVLRGTLTKPEGTGPFTCVVLLSGSGPQDRNSELVGHKPFLVWSDYLTRNGFAVLRFDDRGVAESGGSFSPNTVEGISQDAEAAWNYAASREDIARDAVGFMGHSEGGLIAPMVAARNPDVAFVISLAGPGTTGKQIISDQTGLLLAVQGLPAAEVAEAVSNQSTLLEVLVEVPDPEQQRKVLTQRLEALLQEATPEELETLGGRDAVIARRLEELTDPWYVSFVNHDPAPYWMQTTCPVFALNGDKDLQVPGASNLGGIRSALQSGGNRDGEVRLFPGLNHLFQSSSTGAPSEYGAIETTVEPEVLEAVLEWLQLLP